MTQQPFPGASVPVVDPVTRFFTYPWLTFFQQFAAQPGAITGVVVGASPFSFTASSAGTLMVVGGTGVSVTLSRAGSTVVVNTPVPMANKDVATITYATTPTVSFVPS